MLASEYDEFVSATDLNREKDRAKREDIAIYGLVGEIGALTSAVKRRLIAEARGQQWNLPTSEVIEELGDLLWYLTLLSQIANGGLTEILRGDLRNLRGSLTEKGEKGELFRSTIGSARAQEFQERSLILSEGAVVDIDEYQSTSYLTARTEGQTLTGVCLTVLSQLGAELLRRNFPDVEVAINTSLERREVDVILGEVAWHLAAIASVFQIGLDREVISENQRKLNSRLDKTKKTNLHDDTYPIHEKFLRKFSISFVSVEKDRCRMYLDGKRLGDELTDNSYDNDGYRFHDVMHLANVACLGWSPVLRALLKLKRKSVKQTDEVQDGARAQIVEEAVIKAIHSEGVRISQFRERDEDGNLLPLFLAENEISFQFLRFIEDLTLKLEVSQNSYWEWEQAILQGARVFCELRKEEQGTVDVDLEGRTISFRKELFIDGPGLTACTGLASVNSADFSVDQRSVRSEEDWLGEKARLDNLSLSGREVALELAIKHAVLNSLDLGSSAGGELRITRLVNGLSVKAKGDVQAAIWKRKVVSFRTSQTEQAGVIYCTAQGIADANEGGG